VVAGGQSLSRLLETRLDKLSDSRDRALCSELCYGLCRYFYLLEAQLAARLKKPLKNKDTDLKVILLLGLYQIRFLRVENHAAVNETVNLVKSRGKAWARGLVNAVLRGYLRDLAEQPGQDPTILTSQEQAAAYPRWIQNRVIEDWGELASGIFAAGNQNPPMTLRVDLNQISRAAYLEQLQQCDIDARADPVVDCALVLGKPEAVERLPGFASGQVSVQDAAAQIAAPLLDCRPGMRVLDACAAPGGKSLHLLQSEPGIELLAIDNEESRLRRVEENLTRASVSAQLVCADAAQPAQWYDGNPFDRILLDAPCSASGVIRRHPDIRLLRRDEDIQSLVQQQQRLMLALWPLLKPGGKMLYVTCSMFCAENEQQMEWFVAQQADCVEVTANPVQWGRTRPRGRQILPGMNGMDGFYYALLEKTGTQ
jgi:16S rRNA (cytosine967-C5)-methyltransferase